jgi:hypothetical protein
MSAGSQLPGGAVLSLRWPRPSPPPCRASRPLRHYYLGEAVEVGRGEAVALAGEPEVLSSLAGVLLGAGVCEPAQLRALRAPGGWGDGPSARAALPEGAALVEGVEQLVEGAGGGWGCRLACAGLAAAGSARAAALHLSRRWCGGVLAGRRPTHPAPAPAPPAGLVFVGVAGPAAHAGGQPAARELLRQLAPGLRPGGSGGRVLVLVARSGPGAPGAAAAVAPAEEAREEEEEGALRALVAGAGLHDTPGARVLGLLLRAPGAQAGAGAQPAGPAAAKAAGWPGVGAVALVQLGCASEHDAQLLRSLVEAACGLPVTIRGRAAAAAEAPSGACGALA